jgi:HlyD family secretion protein
MMARLVLLILAATLSLAACSKGGNGQLQGWVEADMLFISPDEAGRVETLGVREGDNVEKGAPLFAVDDDLQKADRVVRQAAVINAQQTFDRAKQLVQTAAGTQKNYDDAEATLRQANANLSAAETRLTRRRVFSPAAGTIQQVYFRVGETVPAGRGVVALLPPENLKVRFFAPQATLPNIRIGETIAVSCDGCDAGLTAKVSFIALSAEYTPPVIYSLEERAKLVFLIEARPEQPEKFRVGQPISVTLPKEPAK